MTLIPIKTDRTSKPPIGVRLRQDGHWSTQGLIAAWPFNEGSGLAYDVSSNLAATLSAGASFGPDGFVGTTDTSYALMSPCPNTLKTQNLTTIAFDVKVDAIGTQQYFFSIPGAYDLGIYSGKVICLGRATIFGTRVLDGNRSHSYYFLKNGSYAEIGVDGIKDTSDATSDHDYWDNAYIGRLNYSFLGSMGGVLIYNRALSPAEIKSISENPWQIFEPIPVWGGMTSEQVASLVIQSAAHAQTAGNITLAQNHALAILNALHGHTTDAIGLTQNHLLAVIDALHAQTAGNATLAQNHLLAVLDSVHAQLAGSSTLSQIHSLIINGGIHALSDDNPELLASIILAIDNAVHAQTSGNLTLQQLHNLIVQGCSHAQTATESEMILSIVLAVTNASHSHAAAQATLQQIHSLLVQGSSHAQTAEEMGLTQNHNIVPSDAYHVTVAGRPTLASIELFRAGDIYALAPEYRMVVLGPENRIIRLLTGGYA